jgi:hypothetical protein
MNCVLHIIQYKLCLRFPTLSFDWWNISNFCLSYSETKKEIQYSLWEWFHCCFYFIHKNEHLIFLLFILLNVNPSSYPYLTIVTSVHVFTMLWWKLFLRPAACLTSTFLETWAGANDCKRSRNQRLNVPYEVWISLNNKFWPPILWLTFENVA